MKLTRDGAALWVAFATTIVLYLLSKPPIVAWTYYDWLAFILMLFTWAIGKLQTSPLSSKNDQ